jgi:fatty acid desaturase
MQSQPELASLRAELRLGGVFEHSEARSWLKMAFLLAVVVACYAGVVIYGWVAGLFLVPIAAVFGTATAMMGHEGSHRSTSKSPMRNAMMAYLAFPIFGGLSSLYWREKHDRLHHGHPNVEGVDPDIRPFPFASSKKDHERCGPKERWFQRTFQKWAFWPMSTLMAVGMRRSSLVHLYNYPKKKGFDGDWWKELAALVTHYSLWLVVPSILFGPLTAFLLYSSIWALVGTFLALVFLPAHAGLPIVSEQNNDWIHQLETTRNLEMPKIVSFFFIGLDYQVEHHLFPKIPHVHLPKAAAITKAWCAKHNVVYHSLPYHLALLDAAKFMADSYTRESMDPIEVRAGLVGNHRAAA